MATSEIFGVSIWLRLDFLARPLKIPRNSPLLIVNPRLTHKKCPTTRATIRPLRRLVFLVLELDRLISHLLIVGRLWCLLDLPYAMLGPPKEWSRCHQG